MAKLRYHLFPNLEYSFKRYEIFAFNGWKLNSTWWAMTLQNNFAKESPAKKPTRSGLQCVAKTDQGEQIKGWSGIPFDGCQTLPAKSRLAFWLFHCSLSKSQANEVAHALRWQSNESERNVITAFKDYIRVCQEARELIHLLCQMHYAPKTFKLWN